MNGNVHVRVAAEFLDFKNEIFFCSEHIVPVASLLEGVDEDLSGQRLSHFRFGIQRHGGNVVPLLGVDIGNQVNVTVGAPVIVFFA